MVLISDSSGIVSFSPCHSGNFTSHLAMSEGEVSSQVWSGGRSFGNGFSQIRIGATTSCNSLSELKDQPSLRILSLRSKHPLRVLQAAPLSSEALRKNSSQSLLASLLRSSSLETFCFKISMSLGFTLFCRTIHQRQTGLFACSAIHLARLKSLGGNSVHCSGHGLAKS